MKKRWAVAASGALASLALIAAAPAASASAPVKFRADGVHIRAKATTNSSSLGLGYKRHSVTGICSIKGQVVSGDMWWMKVKDNSTGVTGYVNQSLILGTGGGGEIPKC
ncbi:hypothetical protein [Streptomyces aureoverticillatus]|uniref:hypothetical protein n=1 Tax=Streptomyces aureoverticillatus TaxID=66871 RepID=UPI0013D95499|nr:hypothetical protein [Streptomyces aureoverticillatus]QIB46093.1 hypothetical protein G3H79_26545 [Streptomyces aureoverticillatus]